VLVHLLNVESGLKRWYELIADWLDFGTELYFVFYEELVEDPLGEVRRLLHYLNLPVDEQRMACTAKHLSGRGESGFKVPLHKVLLAQSSCDSILLFRALLNVKFPGFKVPMDAKFLHESNSTRSKFLWV
jgi:hypothetical protein